MYIPPAFQVDDAGTLAAFMRRHSFATLVTSVDGASFASHLPILFHSESGGHGRLLSHMARANPQWRHFTAGNEALIIFQGPHSYVSPSWYQSKLAVPTWNYAAVHAYGVPTLITDAHRVVQLLEELVRTYESPRERPWAGDLPEEFRDKLIAGIVAFEIPVTRLEGKFKLSQNRPTEDIQGVFRELSSSGDPQRRAVAQLMADEGLVAAGGTSS
jgi:transcriptional regulator